jgi:YbbR domain-containing protein
MALASVRHLGMKFVSIALAALLWLIVSGEQIVERALRIPLELTNLPPQLELVGDAPDVVDVRIRGSSGGLTRIAAGELVAVLDLRSARPGRRLFHLTGSEVRAPFGIEVVQVTPSNVFMTFEPSAMRTVPVVPAVEGEPAAGFVVGTVVADPATVEVVGPRSAVSRLTEAITEPLSVTGASALVTESVTVGVPDPSVRLRTPQSARVSVTIAPAPVEWDIANVPVRVRNGRGASQVSPAEVVVRVRGPRDARNVDASSFEASVDVQDRQPGRFQLPVRVVPPARIGVIAVEPSEVSVRVR